MKKKKPFYIVCKNCKNIIYDASKDNQQGWHNITVKCSKCGCEKVMFLDNLEELK